MNLLTEINPLNAKKVAEIEAGQNVDVDLLDLISRIMSAIDSLKGA